MGIHNNAVVGASGQQGYQIQRSVRLRNSATGYFTRVAGTPTSQNVWTISMWVKLGNLMSSTGAPNGCFFGANQAGNPNESIKWGGPAEGNPSIIYYQSATAGGTHNLTRLSVNNFRDPSAWYHLVFQKNASAASGVGMFLAWVNGVSISFTGAYVGTQASVPNYINTTGSTFNIGAIGTANSLDCYMAEINFVDGQALTPSSFGETNAVTGVWQPKKYTGTYGNNGFYLNFNDNSAATAAAIGKDSSGNGNNFTPSAGISVTAGATYDSMLDTPTPFVDGGNGRGNYCTMNPLSGDYGTFTLSNSNLNFSGARTATATAYARSTIGVSSGKWYWEVTPTDVGAGPNLIVGIQDVSTTALTAGADIVLNGYGYNASTGFKNNNTTQSAYGAAYAANDVIGIALDLDAGTIVFYKNNTSQGTAFTGIIGTYCPVLVMNTGGVARTVAGSINFGQRPFTYTPPTGFLALNTQNLPAPTITNGANHFAATTYTGTGSALSVSNAVNGKSFQPDFVWFKSRATTYAHALFDSVRGVTKGLESDSTAAEQTSTAGNDLSAFTSTGFTVGTPQNWNSPNNATSNPVAWQWKAGGTAVTNTNGSITSQVSANPTAGFSIVTYTGTGANATVGHGLGVAPKLIIVKNRSAIDNWWVYHTSIGATNYLSLNLTDASQANVIAWNNTSPTSSVFSIGTASRVNGSGNSMVAYCFAAVAGYSAFGSYTGNGSTDGAFVYLGFRPKFVMLKQSDAITTWSIKDSSVNTYNAAVLRLYPNTTAAESSGADVDFLSNGFKCRSTSNEVNAAGTYVYAAFAENPFNNSLAR